MASARRSAKGRRSRRTSRGEVAEASLAHITVEATEPAYRRGDFIAKQRQIMDA
jgi:hypothetical protein